jgi:hypothetical protein
MRRAVSELSGEPAPTLNFRQTLVTYDGERAAVVSSMVLSNNLESGYAYFTAHVLEWEPLPDGRSRLKAVTTIKVDYAGETGITATRYEAA